ncbi:thiaminase II [Nesterenkonia alkaliphila]|uniref:Aminopyrimidine aminohydrolase n=1 Tax=Nesterenkonia alkaliphila TaxID=1463631 RepID=A0A7K1UGH0_9MICC|nr:thiaminase II [Nesterenkonia alkaliphila]MVT25567.1 thiaminase II [Nesterenkonia alkaliphila]GFZ95048.1 hypothetical protein GCM10011359_25670 [Nesterenkonia alkaliphila]
MTLFDELKTAAADDWAAYTHHSFVQQLGAGNLPQPAFRHYLIQDYLFLIQFARAYGLAAYKGHSFEDLAKGQAGLQATIEETELHVRLCAGWGISREQMAATAEQPATVAYTRYVLDTGMQGDLLDLHVALSPCVIGYAEIGARLKPALEANPEHPYAEWVAEYSSEDARRLADEAIAYIDQLGARYLSPARFPRLAEIFATATRMEAAFWQMGLDLAAAEE